MTQQRRRRNNNDDATTTTKQQQQQQQQRRRQRYCLCATWTISYTGLAKWALTHLVWSVNVLIKLFLGLVHGLLDVMQRRSTLTHWGVAHGTLHSETSTSIPCQLYKKPSTSHFMTSSLSFCFVSAVERYSQNNSPLMIWSSRLTGR